MPTAMSRSDTTIPAKRSSADIEPYRLSRSMTADDPNNKNLLLDNHSPPPIPVSTRRRVNPDSLAVRLGPELVAVLESYVEPGVIEMPSFAIRQEIQMRFNVDRRHIYDWFHSKGLRVTKEDKRATVEQKTDAMRMQRRMRRCVVPVLPYPKDQPRPNKGNADTQQPLPVQRPPATQPAQACVDALLKPAEPVARSQWTSTPVHHLLRRVDSTFNIPPRPPLGASRTFRDPHIDSVYPICEGAALDQPQRKSYYDTLSRVLGPANGIQECVGTYRSYMERQNEVYYERILPCKHAPTFGAPLASAGSTLSPYCATTADDTWSDSDMLVLASALAFDSDSTSPVSPDAARPPSDDNSFWDSGHGSPTVTNGYIGTIDASEYPAGQDLALPPSAQLVQQQTATSDIGDRALYNTPAFFFSSCLAPFFDNSSSSLAGALGESLPISSRTDQDARRKSRDWTRPRMGRARAYSAGGGM